MRSLGYRAVVRFMEYHCFRGELAGEDIKVLAGRSSRARRRSSSRSRLRDFCLKSAASRSARRLERVRLFSDVCCKEGKGACLRMIE